LEKSDGNPLEEIYWYAHKLTTCFYFSSFKAKASDNESAFFLFQGKIISGRQPSGFKVGIGNQRLRNRMELLHISAAHHCDFELIKYLLVVLNLLLNWFSF